MVKNIKRILMIVLGNLILAFGVAAFMIPHKIIIGGSTGIASCIQHYFHIPLSYTVMLINVVMFIIGYLILGRKFAFTTIVSTCFLNSSIPTSA